MRIPSAPSWTVVLVTAAAWNLTVERKAAWEMVAHHPLGVSMAALYLAVVVACVRKLDGSSRRTRAWPK